MIRPRRAWPLYEKFLRSVAGLGKIDKHRGRERRYDVEHRRAEVLVIGGGSAGREAARRPRRRGAAGRRRRGRRGPPRRRRRVRGRQRHRASASSRAASSRWTRATCFSATAPARSWSPRAPSSSRWSSPETTSSGVVLPEAVRRLVGRWSLKPGERAVVDHRRRGRAGHGRPARAGRHRGRRGRRPARDAGAPDRRQGPRRAPRRRRARRAQGRLRPAGHVRRPPARLRAPRARGRARSSTTPRRGIFVPTDLPDGIEVVGAAAGEVGDVAVPRRHVQRGREEGQVLRLHLRGRDRQGREARHRRGLRLDRAGQALHDRDHGPVPGQALPRPLHPPVRARERDRRGDDRDDDRAPAVAAGRARPARRPPARARAAHVHPPPPQGARREDDVDGHLAPPALLRRPGRRGEERPRDARRDRRLHARQAPDQRARLGRVPRAPLPEPLRRHEARPDPLRRPQLRRRPDHGRRDDRAPLGRGLLRDHDVDGRRRRASSGSSGGTRSGSSTSRSSTSPARSPRSTSPGRTRAS